MYSRFERDSFIRKAIREIKLSLTENDGLSRIQSQVDALFGGYDRKWFSYDAEYQFHKQRDHAKLMRLVNYVFEQKYKVLFADFPCSLEFTGESINIAGRFVYKLEQTVETMESVCIVSGNGLYSRIRPLA